MNNQTFTKKQATIIIIMVIFGFLYLYYNGYRLEKIKYTSLNEKICGKVSRIYDISKGDPGGGGGEYKLFDLISSQNKIMTFSRGGNFFKEKYSPYWSNNQLFFSKMQVGERVCVTYSLQYFDGHSYTRQVPPYLIHINYQ